MPVVMLASFFTQRAMGMVVPIPHIPLAAALLLSALFFVAATAEELGWSAYATEPLQARWGAFSSGIALEIAWAAFHIVPLVEVHRSVGWIAWWSLGTIPARVIIVRRFSGAGNSVFVASLFHMMVNVCRQLYPVHGSFFDPRVSSPIMALVALGVVAMPDRNRTLRPS